MHFFQSDFEMKIRLECYLVKEKGINTEEVIY